MRKLFLSEIYIYPVKSLGGINLKISEVEPRGLKYDRRWMLVDEKREFLTQRINPQMALISVGIKDNKLEFNHKTTGSSFSLNLVEVTNNEMEVIIWNDKVIANIVSEKANEWFSDTLRIKCRLVYMNDNTIRPVDKNYSHNNEVVNFADAFPFLIIGQSSLDDLNTRLQTKLPMNRFRPNLVFNGGEPFAEDRIKCFSIGNITFYPVKPCARCVVTTIDQETGIKSEEPLRTLSTYRTFNNKINFGQNLIHKGTGIISVGDELKIIEKN